MARHKQTTAVSTRKFAIGMNWQTVLMSVGIAVLAPYLFRRLRPLFEDGLMNITGRDVALAGKDSVRDAADDLEVGGVSGKVKRTVNRAVDHLSH